MRAVITRVTGADVQVAHMTVGRIGPGLLVLVAVTHSDTTQTAAKLAHKIYEVRILRGESSLAQSDTPEALVVSQFTLYGDVAKGRRPSWAAAAPAPVAQPLFETLIATLEQLGVYVQSGVFGADMQVNSTNDGPVTLIVEA